MWSGVCALSSRNGFPTNRGDQAGIVSAKHLDNRIPARNSRTQSAMVNPSLLIQDTFNVGYRFPSSGTDARVYPEPSPQVF
jgi:hypothetical protein